MKEVLCDRMIGEEKKAKVFESVVMTYGNEKWPVMKTREKRPVLVEMRIFRWSMSKTRRDTE